MTSAVPARYRVEEQLGRGGMGVVYRATDTQLERTVALKLLDTALDEASRAPIVREARAASALNHPSICTVYEVTDVGGRPCIVMEHVDGTPLGQLVPPGGLDPALVVRYGIQIADALAHAHARGVVHRDLKSGNVMVTPDGRAKVLDFGLASRLSDAKRAAITEVGDAGDDLPHGGTLPYMSPQALAGRPPATTDDIWSLGVLLYELAAGELPFRGDTRFEVAAAIQRDAPAPLPAGVPPGLRAVILRCLARDTSTGYGRAEEVRAALDAVHAGVHVPLRRPRVLPQTAALVALAAAIGLAVAVVSTWRTAPPAAPVSIAVLPFANVGENRHLEYLTDGLAESVISSLARVPGKVAVTAWTAVQHYRGVPVDAKAVGGALGVAAVLQGSVEERGDTVAVVVELVSTGDQTRLWGESYHTTRRELMTVPQDIVARISSALQLQLSRDEQQALRDHYPASAEALELYLKGQYHLYRSSPEDYRRSLKHFRDAIKREPTYAAAHAGLARALSTLVYDGYLPPSAYRDVEQAARMALQYDAALGAAHDALGRVKIGYEWNWRDADLHFRRALELSPNDETTRRRYALFLRSQRRWDEAIAEMQRAVALNPVSAETMKTLGATYFWAGRHDLAIAAYTDALALDPALAQAHDLLADAYAAKGRYADALEARRRYLRFEGAFEAADGLGTDTSAAGYRRAMHGLYRRYLARLDEDAGRPELYVSPMEFAMTYIALGEADRAFVALDEAFGQRSPWLSTLAADPAFDPIRADPRFARLVARVGVPPPSYAVRP